jgi:predicted cupin superfamily sugar epimerase
MTAEDIIAALNLAPHPEGGFYRQTWVADAAPGDRPAGTAIYFLLKVGAPSHWHKVDATEIWHFHAGAPLRLRNADTEQGPAKIQTLGADIPAGHRPQGIVPVDHWQSAETTGGLDAGRLHRLARVLVRRLHPRAAQFRHSGLKICSPR